MLYFLFFCFQAEDGIRDGHVTGVQTCALPIYVHSATAAEIFSVPLSDVSGDQRYAAKAINFGLIYGMSQFGLANNLGITRDAAKAYIDRILCAILVWLITWSASRPRLASKAMWKPYLGVVCISPSSKPGVARGLQQQNALPSTHRCRAPPRI